MREWDTRVLLEVILDARIWIQWASCVHDFASREATSVFLVRVRRTVGEQGYVILHSAPSPSSPVAKHSFCHSRETLVTFCILKASKFEYVPAGQEYPL